jgi:hypothetical protein
MVGATNLGAGNNGLSFRFKMCKQFNYCEISVNSKDLYDMKFLKIRGMNISNECVSNDLYGEQLTSVFEKQTGLATSL